MPDSFSIRVDLDVRSDGSTFKKTEKNAEKAGKKAGSAFAGAFGSKVKGQISGTIKRFAGIAVAAVGFRAITQEVTKSISAMRNFSRAMANVNSILPRNNKLTKESADTFRDFAGSFATSSAKQADAFYTIVSAGIKGTTKQLNTLEAANTAAIAGLVDINDATKVLVSSVNSYAQSGLTAKKASDILFVAVREGQTTFQELSQFLGNVAPVAAAAGLKFEELAGAIAGITKAGIKTDVAVTGIRAVLASLIKVTPEAALEAKRIGLEFNTAALKAKGFTGFLRSVQVATKGNVETLGKLFPNVRALTPILQVVNGNFEDFARIQEEVKNSLNATADAAEIVKQNLDFKLSRATANFALLEQELINGLVPALGESAAALTRFLVLNRSSASELSKNRARTEGYRVELEKWSGVMKDQGVPALKEWNINSTFAQRKVFALTGEILKLTVAADRVKDSLRLKESPYDQLIQANIRLKDLKDRLKDLKDTDGGFDNQQKSADQFLKSLNNLDFSKESLSQDTDITLLSDIEAEENKIRSITAAIDLLKKSLKSVPMVADNTQASMVRAATGVLDFFKGISIGVGTFSTDFKTRTKQMEAQSKAVANTMRQAFAGTISGGIQEVIKSMRQGQSELDAFSKVFLQMIGDMAIKVGETLILTGIGINSLSALDGFQAIAAGAGLVAIGQIIKSSAGGGGSDFSSSSGGGSGGGNSFSDSPEALTAPELEDRAPTTNVEIVVQGSLVQQEELGSFITETLNETFGKQGLTITDARFA